MSALAKATFMGRLTSDPTEKTIGDSSLVTFSLAVNLPGKGGEKSAHFFDFEAWRGAGEYIAKFAKKGDSVYLEADLRIDTFEDKDGKPRKKTKLVVKPMTFMFQSGAQTPKGSDSEGIASGSQTKARRPQTADKVEDPDLGEDVPW